jgi:ketosteroid isomerase-like protein
MQKLFSALVLLAFAVACGQQAEEAASDEAAAPTVSTEADVEAIAAVQNQEVEVFLSGDANLPHLADNAVLMPPNEPAVVGIEAARAWATEFFAPNDGGDPTSLTFKGTHVYERQTDGSWKMAQDIWNYDGAPAGE